MTTINLLLIVLLIALTAFFVATEFAIVKVRSSRIDQLISEGSKSAIQARKVISHLDEYLSACQLGITITALGLGWLGKPTIEKLLYPVFQRFDVNEGLGSFLSFIIAFSLVTFLHVVIGELAPKTVAIQKAEAVTLLFARPIIWFYRLMYPFIWFLNGSARLLIRAFGLKPVSEHEAAHTEEELRILLSESFKGGEINKNELKYMNNIFEFDERLAREIMVPRTEIVAISMDDRVEDVLSLIEKENYTRYPVMDGNKDSIKGFINAKEFLTEVFTTKNDLQTLKIEQFVSPIIHVIDSSPVQDLLVKMQKERTHIAILVDEYGGTSGLITFEDILEEIVGEIRDEFDDDELPDIRKLSDGRYIINAKLLIEDVNVLLGINLPHEDVDTIGGWFLSQNIDPEVGSEISTEGCLFKVVDIDGHQLHYLEIYKTA